MKLPIPTTTRQKFTTTLGIDSYPGSAGEIEYFSLINNGVVRQDDIGPYITARPGVSVIEDAGNQGAPAIGRGLAAFNQKLYLFNDNKVYEESYAGTSLTIGTSSANNARNRIHTTEAGALLVIVDPYQNDAWTMTTVPAVTSIATAPATIVSGVVHIDGWTFIAAINGYIYNSDLNDATAGYSDFIAASRSNDAVRAIALHHDHLVAIGANTIEFFSVSDNTVGTPLQRRQDISFNVGLAINEAFDVYEDRIVFMGRSGKGGAGLYMLQDFQLTKISDSELDTLLQVHASTQELLTVTCFGSDGEMFVQLGEHIIWHEGHIYRWDIGENLNASRIVRAIMNLEDPTYTREYHMMLDNGDYVKFDTANYDGDLDVVPTLSSFTVDIWWPAFNGETAKWKYCQSVELLSLPPASTHSLDYGTGTLQYADDGQTFNTAVSLEIPITGGRYKVQPCGRFSNRQFRFTYETLASQYARLNEFRLYGLDVELGLGG